MVSHSLGLRVNRLLMTAAMSLLVCGQAWVVAAQVSAEGRSAGAAQTAASPNYKGSGVIKGLNAASGTIVLAHEPVPALKWPAMTMPFKIAPQLAKGLKVGQRVDFEFHAQGMNGTISAIQVRP
jgi:Cu(I)/Ag(I) efflux system periplasmic protein CusF